MLQINPSMRADIISVENQLDEIITSGLKNIEKKDKPIASDFKVEENSKNFKNSELMPSSLKGLNELVPRLCRFRAFGSNLGFFVLASTNSLGVFKVSDIAANSPASYRTS